MLFEDLYSPCFLAVKPQENRRDMFILLGGNHLIAYGAYLGSSLSDRHYLAVLCGS